MCSSPRHMIEADLTETVAELRRDGIETDGLALDVSNEDAAPTAVERSVELYGRLDVLISNAGIAYYEELLDTPVEHLDRALAVNVRGTFLFAQAAAHVMVHGGGGAISTTVSSAASLGEEFQVIYNASKAAVGSMTRSLAVDLARHRIRVNGVAPGWVRTRSTEPVIRDEALWAKYRARIPLDRAADPHEIASLHAFLVSDDASYLTGAILAADGGVTAGMRWSGWAAMVDPTDEHPIGIAGIPPTLGRKTV